jgi:hypothetical protein
LESPVAVLVGHIVTSEIKVNREKLSIQAVIFEYSADRRASIWILELPGLSRTTPVTNMFILHIEENDLAGCKTNGQAQL